MVHKGKVSGPTGGDHGFAERHGFKHAKPETLRTVQRHEDIAVGVERQHLGVGQARVDQVDTWRLVAPVDDLLRQWVHLSVVAAVVQLDDQVGFKPLLAGALEGVDGSEGVFPPRVAGRLHDGDKQGGLLRQSEIGAANRRCGLNLQRVGGVHNRHLVQVVAQTALDEP